MSNLIPKVSRIKRGCAETVANHMLMRTACETADAEGRPFTIVDGYDSAVIGAYTEYTIWYKADSVAEPMQLAVQPAAVVTSHRTNIQLSNDIYVIQATGSTKLHLGEKLYAYNPTGLPLQ